MESSDNYPVSRGWFYDYCHQSNLLLKIDLHRELAQATRIPLASGEHMSHHEEVTDLMSTRAVRYFQPDVGNIGGIAAMRNACHVADSFGAKVSTHDWCGTRLQKNYNMVGFGHVYRSRYTRQQGLIMRNNIYQSLIYKKRDNVLWGVPHALDTDYNCFTWDPDNPNRHITYQDPRNRTGPKLKGLAEMAEELWQRH